MLDCRILLRATDMHRRMVSTGLRVELLNSKHLFQCSAYFFRCSLGTTPNCEGHHLECFLLFDFFLSVFAMCAWLSGRAEDLRAPLEREVPREVREEVLPERR